MTATTAPLNVLALCGSLRKDSLNAAKAPRSMASRMPAISFS